jgi:toxin ParE1/3/4
MACKLIWSPAARDDLRDIVRFIARDNPHRAESFGYELMTRTDILNDHPEAGRIVQNTGTPESARLSIERIVTSIASILSDNW